jgi:hypothetical protein
MKASSKRVREGVFCRYWFHTWRATSCGEDLFDKDELGFKGAVEGVGEETALECEGRGFVGGGVAPDEDFLGAIACSDPKDRESKLPEVEKSGR